ncbi:MAG: xanthine dehydrogenase family protein subunit M [Sneathiella sp.]
MGDYFRPTTLSELEGLLTRGNLTVLAGGTDYYPAKVGKLLGEDILDITAVDGLRGIQKTKEGWRIGATTRWSDITRSDLPPLFDGLKAAAREVGGQQIQNSGTIGGNLCNASPAADGVPALLSLGADVEISGPTGMQRLPLETFILGNRKTTLEKTEILSALHIPNPLFEKAYGAFLKLGSRKYLVISLVMVAGTFCLDAEGRLADCKISVGACSEVAKRLERLEQDLIGAFPTDDLAGYVVDTHLADLSPIDDVRATAEYRLEVAKTLVQRMLSEWGETV